MADFFNKSFNKEYSNLSEKDKNKMQDDIFGKKPSLSSKEAEEFKKILYDKKQKDEKYKRHETLKTSARLSDIMYYIDKTRQSILENLYLEPGEKAELEHLQANLTSIENRRNYFQLVFLTIDVKFLDDEKLSLKEAIESKFLFFLGLPDFKHIEEDSRKSVLFGMMNLIREYSYYAYNVSDSVLINDANRLLSQLASVISISSSDNVKTYTSNSLHMHCIMQFTNTSSNYSIYVSDEDANTQEFRNVYDFYFKHNKESIFESLVAKKNIDVRKQKIMESKSKVSKARSNVDRILTKYSTVLDTKLKSLRKKNDGQTF